MLRAPVADETVPEAELTGDEFVEIVGTVTAAVTVVVVNEGTVTAIVVDTVGVGRVGLGSPSARAMPAQQPPTANTTRRAADLIMGITAFGPIRLRAGSNSWV